MVKQQVQMLKPEFTNSFNEPPFRSVRVILSEVPLLQRSCQAEETTAIVEARLTSSSVTPFTGLPEVHSPCGDLGFTPTTPPALCPQRVAISQVKGDAISILAPSRSPDVCPGFCAHEAGEE